MDSESDLATLDIYDEEYVCARRLQEELQNANDAIEDINCLSKEFHKARDEFKVELNAAREKIQIAYKRYPHGIEKARPYFDSKAKLTEAKAILTDLTERTRDAQLDWEDAREAEVLAEQLFETLMDTQNKDSGGINDPTMLAKLNQANERVIGTDLHRKALEKDHSHQSEYVDSLDLYVAKLGYKLRHHLEAAWPFFKLKAELKEHLDVKYHALKRMHENLTLTKRRQENALQATQQLSTSLAKYQAATSGNMQLSEFAELTDFEVVSLECGTDEEEGFLTRSSASMLAMCSMDSTHSAQFRETQQSTAPLLVSTDIKTEDSELVSENAVTVRYANGSQGQATDQAAKQTQHKKIADVSPNSTETIATVPLSATLSHDMSENVRNTEQREDNLLVKPSVTATSENIQQGHTNISASDKTNLESPTVSNNMTDKIDKQVTDEQISSQNNSSNTATEMKPVPELDNLKDGSKQDANITVNSVTSDPTAEGATAFASSDKKSETTNSAVVNGQNGKTPLDSEMKTVTESAKLVVSSDQKGVIRASAVVSEKEVAENATLSVIKHENSGTSDVNASTEPTGEGSSDETKDTHEICVLPSLPNGKQSKIPITKSDTSSKQQGNHICDKPYQTSVKGLTMTSKKSVQNDDPIIDNSQQRISKDQTQIIETTDIDCDLHENFEYSTPLSKYATDQQKSTIKQHSEDGNSMTTYDNTEVYGHCHKKDSICRVGESISPDNSAPGNENAQVLNKGDANPLAVSTNEAHKLISQAESAPIPVNNAHGAQTVVTTTHNQKTSFTCEGSSDLLGNSTSILTLHSDTNKIIDDSIKSTTGKSGDTIEPKSVTYPRQQELQQTKPTEAIDLQNGEDCTVGVGWVTDTIYDLTENDTKTSTITNDSKPKQTVACATTAYPVLAASKSGNVDEMPKTADDIKSNTDKIKTGNNSYISESNSAKVYNTPTESAKSKTSTKLPPIRDQTKAHTPNKDHDHTGKTQVRQQKGLTTLESTEKKKTVPVKKGFVKTSTYSSASTNHHDKHEPETPTSPKYQSERAPMPKVTSASTKQYKGKPLTPTPQTTNSTSIGKKVNADLTNKPTTSDKSQRSQKFKEMQKRKAPLPPSQNKLIETTPKSSILEPTQHKEQAQNRGSPLSTTEQTSKAKLEIVNAKTDVIAVNDVKPKTTKRKYYETRKRPVSVEQHVKYENVKSTSSRQERQETRSVKDNHIKNPTDLPPTRNTSNDISLAKTALSVSTVEKNNSVATKGTNNQSAAGNEVLLNISGIPQIVEQQTALLSDDDSDASDGTIYEELDSDFDEPKVKSETGSQVEAVFKADSVKRSGHFRIAPTPPKIDQKVSSPIRLNTEVPNEEDREVSLNQSTGVSRQLKSGHFRAAPGINTANLSSSTSVTDIEQDKTLYANLPNKAEPIYENVESCQNVNIHGSVLLNSQQTHMIDNTQTGEVATQNPDDVCAPDNAVATETEESPEQTDSDGKSEVYVVSHQLGSRVANESNGDKNNAHQPLQVSESECTDETWENAQVYVEYNNSEVQTSNTHNQSDSEKTTSQQNLAPRYLENKGLSKHSEDYGNELEEKSDCFNRSQSTVLGHSTDTTSDDNVNTPEANTIDLYKDQSETCHTHVSGELTIYNRILRKEEKVGDKSNNSPNVCSDTYSEQLACSILDEVLKHLKENSGVISPVQNQTSGSVLTSATDQENDFTESVTLVTTNVKSLVRHFDSQSPMNSSDTLHGQEVSSCAFQLNI